MDTIEMLEAIGCNASLRHASATELTAALEKIQAPAAITTAVATGDDAALYEALGSKFMWVPQISQIFFRRES
ncbi:MAG: hypothetical protein ABWX83_12380 [Luteibacter sp.]|jgi:hypothetical protein